MTPTPSRTVLEHKAHNGKQITEGVIKTFLWDNPELKKAFAAIIRREKERTKGH